MDVVGADTVSVTGTVCGVLVAPPVAVNVMAALYVPAASPDVLMVTEMESVSAVVVPETAFRVSHVALSLTDQDSVPLPVFVKFTVFAVGLPAPWMAVNERLAGLSPMVGFCTALTVRVTDMVLGVFVAPPAVIVIGAL